MTAQEAIEAIRREGEKARRIGVPRVSTVLRGAAVSAAGSFGRDSGDSLAGARLGTSVHRRIEQMIREGTLVLPEDTEPEAAPAVISFRDWWRAWLILHRGYATATEIPVGDRRWPLRGTADFLAVKSYRAGKKQRFDLSLVDWKTSAKGRFYESRSLPQLAAYRRMAGRALRRAGVEDLTLDCRVILLDPLGGPARMRCCHQTDADTIQRKVEQWTHRYYMDEDYRAWHDAETEAELKRAV